jgi:external thioesterase TEII
MKRTQLFLVHFAGGNRYSYQFMIPQLSRHFDTIPIELPGRGKRINEPLLTDFHQASCDLYEQISTRLSDASFIIFGHSMGALLALRIAGMLQNDGKLPNYLFVSGSASPEGIERKSRHLLNHQAFVDELKEIGGMPPGVLENQELLQIFEPILRADFEIIDNHSSETTTKLEVPVCALMGNKEDHVEDISSWKNVTKSIFDYEIFDGGHFFIYDHAQGIVDMIVHRYETQKRTYSNLP